MGVIKTFMKKGGNLSEKVAVVINSGNFNA
jgi:hypothetical protein